MGALVNIYNTMSPRLVGINTSVSNVVTNTTTDTAFDTIWTFPSQSQRYAQAPMMIRFRACGLFSTDIATTSITLNVHWDGMSGTTIGSTGLFTLPISQTDMLWWIQGFMCLTSVGQSASLESQWFTAFDGNATMTARQKNTTPFTVDTINAHDVVISAQWGTATANNKINVRTALVELDGP